MVCQECGDIVGALPKEQEITNQTANIDCHINAKIYAIKEFHQSIEAKERVRLNCRMRKSGGGNFPQSNLPSDSEVEEFNRLDNKRRDLVVERDTLKQLSKATGQEMSGFWSEEMRDSTSFSSDRGSLETK